MATNNETSITKEQHGEIARYTIHPKNGDWAVILIHPEQNMIFCYSMAGNFNYRFIQSGDFRDFLTRLNFQYAMSKFIGKETYFDEELTAKELRNSILDSRRWESITAEQARKMWKNVAQAEAGHKDEFMDCIGSGDYGRQDQAWYDRGCYTYHPHARHFWDHAWKALIEQLKQELAEPATV